MNTPCPPTETPHNPSTVSLLEAATLPLAGLTALQIVNWLKLTQGQTLLVTGAAGAVGGLAVQLATNEGIIVDGLVSRPEHIDAAPQLGANNVTDQAGRFGGTTAPEGELTPPGA